MNRYPMFSPQLLVSFVAVCETMSFTRAADRVSLSQSTVSQQVRRLEELLGKALFERTSHEVRLTEEGIKLLSYARRIIALNEEAHDALTGPWRDGVLRLGMPEDFTVPPEPLLWLDSKEHPAIDQAPVPLAVFPVNGLYREELCETLDGLGIRWRVSYSGGGLAALAAASAAGLGVSLLPASCLLPAHRVLGTAERLPPIDDFELALFYRDNASAIALDLAGRLIDFCGLNS